MDGYGQAFGLLRDRQCRQLARLRALSTAVVDGSSADDDGVASSLASGR